MTSLQIQREEVAALVVPAKTKKVCPCCGEEFETKKSENGNSRNAQKYCSPQCRKKYASRAYELKDCTCRWCGKDFKAPKRRKYCSDECRLYANGRGKRKSKTNKTLIEVAQLAHKEGLTYGQYVAKYGL